MVLVTFVTSTRRFRGERTPAVRRRVGLWIDPPATLIGRQSGRLSIRGGEADRRTQVKGIGRIAAWSLRTGPPTLRRHCNREPVDRPGSYQGCQAQARGRIVVRTLTSAIAWRPALLGALLVVAAIVLAACNNGSGGPAY
jgi:hypothetical protein